MDWKSLIGDIVRNKHFQNFFWEVMQDVFHAHTAERNSSQKEVVEEKIAQTAANKPNKKKLVDLLRKGKF
jgi:G:T/U-mismatch repair DNA glycosylase